jgi:hypothetical protein
MSDVARVEVGERAIRSAHWLVAVGGILAIDVLSATAGQYHWWANFILVPGAVLTAFASPAGRWRHPAWNIVLWTGVIVTLVGVLLTFNAMGSCWPLMISVPSLGLAVTVGRTLPRVADPSARAVVRSVIELAGLGGLLGVVLMLIIHDVVDIGQYRWWTVFMITSGAVPLSNGMWLLALRRGTDWFSTAILLMGIGAAAAFCGFRAIGGW